MVQRFKETGHLVFKSTSALSRGILKQRKGIRTIHFNGDSMNTELLFQTVHPENQLSVYGAGVINSVWHKKKKDESVFLWTTRFLTMVEPEEVDMLVSPPTQAHKTGCREAR